LLGWKDLGLETIPDVTFFLLSENFQQNLVEFVFKIEGISTPEIISPSF
jgi:hypothetical protein